MVRRAIRFQQRRILRHSLSNENRVAFRIVLNRCAITIVLRCLPFAMTASSADWTSFSDSLSRADVASSNNRYGSCTIARAIAILCFCIRKLVSHRRRHRIVPLRHVHDEFVRVCNFSSFDNFWRASLVGEPEAMLSCADPENKTGSCSTRPI